MPCPSARTKLNLSETKIFCPGQKKISRTNILSIAKKSIFAHEKDGEQHFSNGQKFCPGQKKICLGQNVFVQDKFDFVLDKNYFVRAEGRGINLQKRTMWKVNSFFFPHFCL